MSAVEEELEAAAEAADKTSPTHPRIAADQRIQAAEPTPQTFEGRLLRWLLTLLNDPPVEFVTWDGQRIGTGNGVPAVAQVRIQDRATLYGLMKDPQVRFGDAYSDGRIQIEGDLVAFLEAVYRANISRKTPQPAIHRLVRWLNKPRVNSLDGSRENIHHHYNIGNEFYKLWLGNTMSYTCAYYPTATTTLDQAQDAKMHHVCRKLRLKPGQTVVEAGFGWGTLALHMARHYGVKVRAYNIAHEQVIYARERAKREGLDGQIEYIEDDYRNISGKYDAFVSVGMLEHVGAENYPELGRVARRSLQPHGLGLIHSIGRNRAAALHPWIERRIFPGAYPPALSEMANIFEPCDLSILDVENLRLHYARTLTHWLGLYETSKDRVKAMFDEKFVRMWRLYLAGSIAGFTTGTLQLFQVVFAPRESNEVPMTREHLYS